jgi:hypothetical protein
LREPGRESVASQKCPEVRRARNSPLVLHEIGLRATIGDILTNPIDEMCG